MDRHTPEPWGKRPYEMGGRYYVSITSGSDPIIDIATVSGNDRDIVEANADLIIASPDLLSAMPTLPHPGGRLVKVVAYYEDGTTQTIDGEVISNAVARARGGEL